MQQDLSSLTKTVSEIGEIKRIYSSIKAYLPESQKLCITFTSSVNGEGKTISVAGLSALAARETGKRILAIDLNWYRPCLHTYFNLNLIPPDRITGDVKLEDLIQPSGIRNLDILTARQPDAEGDGFHGDEISIVQKLISRAREIYDFTFVDTSKVFPMNRRMIDPIEIAKHSDGVVLLVLANATHRQTVKRAQCVLEAAGTKLLGVIINNWKNPLA